jgi:tol-pal system protein YbgF
MFERLQNTRAGLCAALLVCVCGWAHAGLFDDEEARKQIAVEKKRVDDLSADLKTQQQSVDARVGKLEEALKSQALLDLFTQIESLKVELNKLRGQIEVLNNSVENTTKRQRDMYLDLDTRMTRIEQQGGIGPAAGPVVPGAPATPATPATAAVAAPVPVATPAAPANSPPAAGTAAAAPVPAVSPGDQAAEARTYESAQAQRRIGNYQGTIVAFQNFIKQYPKSNLAPRAQYWIGDSYFNLRDFKLAIASQQTLIKTYPESPTVPDAMLNVASSQIEMGESNAGKKSLEELVKQFPISDAADKAKRRLSVMNATAAAPAAKP